MILKAIGVLSIALGLSIAGSPRESRIDCLPIPGSNEEQCTKHGCVWDSFYDDQNPTVPLCYYPENVGGYNLTVDGKIKTLGKRHDGPENLFSPDIDKIFFSTSNIGATFNVKIGSTKRFDSTTYEIPIAIPKERSQSTDGVSIEILSKEPFYFAVKRKSNSRVLWDTSIGGFVFSDQYIQIATYLPSKNVYGFGENIHTSLKHNFDEYTTWAMFARDEPPNSYGHDRKNLYGTLPFYMCLEDDGKAHGVLIWNSNAQEITTGPSPHLIYRTIGGMLDIYFFPGPSPEEVVQQYLALVGRPMLPAYFALGFQLCRYGYKNLDEMKEAVARTQANGIPLDIPYADIDYMDRYKDFTTGSQWSDFPNYAKKLHDDGLHLFLIFDPAIQVDYASYERAVKMGASFLEWERQDQVPKDINGLYPLTKDSKVMLGVVWPDAHTAFPDFLDPSNKTTEWWTNEFKLYHDQLPFDGIWIDMNEPSSFGTNIENPWYYGNNDHPNIKPLMCPVSGTDSKYDMPPYQTNAVYRWSFNSYLSTNTMCMCALTGKGKYRFYDTKTLYGLSEAIATQEAIYKATGKRGAIISRSTFPSAGHYAGHWLGDNTARWEDLRTSVIGAQEFNILGIPYVGSDICGFIGDTTEELCLRWQQMGAFHPFSRNHNTNNAKPQDPGLWPTVAAAAREALLFRYKYLPYLYSLHFHASRFGGTVIRPLFFEFPHEYVTYDKGHQFLWGSGLMIIPVLEQDVVIASGYLPEAQWYSLRDNEYGTLYPPGENRFSAKTTELIPVLVRGGVILPRQQPSTTTTASRKNPFEILIAAAYDMNDGKPKSSTGELYFDDGESIVRDFQTYNFYMWTFSFSFTDTSAELTITMNHEGNQIVPPTLDVIEIVGYRYTMNRNSILINGLSVPVTVTSPSKNVVNISKQGMVNMHLSPSFTITWTHHAAN
uniref:Maltase n=1 Tax=Syphacia muris TaxID=451379 RepID=A0A0N5AMQ5_9BILA